MSFNEIKILDDYNNGMSPPELAEKYGTYSNKIRRILKKYTALRGRGEANKIAMDRGRKPHPTKGKTLTEEHKVKISEAAAKNWDEMSDEEYDNYVDGCRKRWNNMSEAEKQKMNDSAHDAIRLSAKEGSKLERYIVESIRSTGLTIDSHRTGLIANDKLEVDIYLPEIATCIEVDGPSHFFPIWGQTHLNKQIKADLQKAGLLLNAGYVLIRIKCITTHLSEKHKRALLGKLLPVLISLKKQKPVKQVDRFIEIEV